jgi:hypothetical protein
MGYRGKYITKPKDINEDFVYPYTAEGILGSFLSYPHNLYKERFQECRSLAGRLPPVIPYLSPCLKTMDMIRMIPR